MIQARPKTYYIDDNGIEMENNSINIDREFHFCIFSELMTVDQSFHRDYDYLDETLILFVNQRGQTLFRSSFVRRLYDYETVFQPV